MTNYANLSDDELLAQYQAVKDPFTAALKAEGVTGPLAEIARSIYTQESAGGKNTKTSNRGAVGGMQILPGTFAEVADKDWSVSDPLQNIRGGLRYLKKGYEASGGDPALTGAFYYGGPGGLEKAKRGIAVSDPMNPNAPNTLQYGQQVAARLPKEKGLIQRGVEAVIPSANAAETAKNPFEGMSDADLMAAYKQAQSGKPASRGGAQGSWDGEQPGMAASLGAAVGKGVGTVALGAQRVVGKGLNAVDSLLGSQRNLSSLVNGQAAPNSPLGSAGEWLVNDADQGRAKLAAENAPYKAANPVTNAVGEVIGNVAATLPVGPLLGAGAKALGATRLGSALATGGATTGANVAQGIAPATTNMLLRMAGGAGAGAASAGLIDPNATTTGAVVGAALPPVLSGVGAVAKAAGAALRPFTSSGQDRIAGNTLREFATDPAAARQALLQSREIVPGSAPTTAAASGDAGIAAVSRSMQGADLGFAGDLAARQTAQNQARTAALEGIAGNTGKIDIAKQARDAVTGTMREEALSAAGKVPAQGILQQIDNLIADPNNAGQLSQQALNQFKSRIAANVKDGTVDARALYAIRKDINDVLGGKLQGEAGNLRYASSQLSGVKGFIDDAIDQASKSMPANAIGPTTRGAPDWKGYLRKYAQESVPINQMEKLEGVLKSIQTGTVDSQGGAIISAAKLNNILKNQGSDLVKELSPAQLQVLRNIQADLNAGQIAANVGKAGRSDTFQNFAQNQLLESALGKTLGGSTAASSTLGRLLQIPYGTANKQIQGKLGNALLDPQEAARLLADPKNNALLQALTQNQLPYRAAPAISAR